MEQLTAFSTILDTPPALTARLYGFFDKAAAFACDALAAMVEADEKKIKKIKEIRALFGTGNVKIPVWVDDVRDGTASISTSEQRYVSIRVPVRTLSAFSVEYTDGTVKFMGDAPVNKEGR